VLIAAGVPPASMWRWGSPIRSPPRRSSSSSSTTPSPLHDMDLLRTAGAEVARFAAELGSRQGAISESWEIDPVTGNQTRSS
jgi:hypothetical protein